MTRPQLKVKITIAVILWMLIFLFVQDAANAKREKPDGSEPIVSKIIVDVQGINGDVRPWAGVVNHLIFIRQGEPFSPKRFKDSLEALKSSKVFKAVHVFETSEKDDRLAIHFQVTPYPRVKDIKINGEFPLLEREILNAMQLRPGDGYHPEMFSAKKAAVIRLFKAEGYIAPKADLQVKDDPADGNVIVYVDIDKGYFFHVRRFDINGNRAFSKKRLEFRLKTYKSRWVPDFMRRFRKKDLDNDIKNLILFYRKKGYPDVSVNRVVDKDAQTQNVSIALNIHEGPRYDIEFQGNTAFGDYRLKKDLILFKQGNEKDFGLIKSIRNIKKRYLNAGYKDCRIEMKSEIKQQRGRSIRKIRFIIAEGPQYIVNSVQITGNNALDAGKIKNAILTKLPGIFRKGVFVSKILDEDKRSVTALYLKRGYPDVVVKSDIAIKKDIRENKERVDVTFNISEGAEVRVASVTFPGLALLSESEALRAVNLKKGLPFRSYMVQSDENTLSSMISEKGYPHVNVKGSAIINKDTHEAAVTYKVDQGPFVKMGHVASVGNFITKRRVIQNEMELDPGEPFSLKKFLGSQRNIRDIDAFDTVRFETFGLKEKSDSVNLLTEPEEKKPYYIQTGGGYDTERGFYANILSGDRNLFGLNKHLWAGGEISQIGYRGDLGFSDPRFLGTRIKSAINVFSEKKEAFNTNFGTREKGVSISFSRKFYQKFNADLSFVYSYKTTYPRDSEPIAIDEDITFGSREILTISPSLVYNDVDSFIRPKKGLYSSLILDVSKGIHDSLDDFFRYRFETRKYYTPIKNITFALRGRIGDITPFDGAANIPEDQLFFLGGTSTVRGFDQNLLRFDASGKAVGGLTSILGNFETRIGLGSDFELSFFYDIGSIRNAVVNEGSDEFRSSIGMGLHYFTPIGPVGVYYGHKLDRKPGESAGRFHFTLGFRF
ncbi:MAG: outer membrane protein assembly factor BamA [Desulfobacterales bacterium]